MRNRLFLIITLLSVLLSACSSLPKNYSNYPLEDNTGLDQLIRIDGCYVFQRACDPEFFSICRFSPDGNYRVASAKTISPELIRCFVSDDQSILCNNILAGRYRLAGDTIRAEAIWPVGNGCVVFRDYLISQDKLLYNLNEYIEPDYSNLGYLRNYPSFFVNDCMKPAEFIADDK